MCGMWDRWVLSRLLSFYYCYQTEMIAKLEVLETALSSLDLGNAIPGKLAQPLWPQLYHL